ncbi:hypothetical protein ESZ50_04140 [Weissella muntiaci]|uniref:Uncharacterized protein n=1 Tax=Weissella muntiaci TaxID=2508881 RepID=A0A6C2C8R4_9LACO|nr:hypothetical protein [Weissella muntiaci]TYC49986.1 hypothetical protein ESZ50_04140 [Weissella muntiaci]
MLTSYKELLEKYNPAVPEKLRLPVSPKESSVMVGDADSTMDVKFNGDEVSQITFELDDDQVEGVYYQMFVKGLEGGMGWSSSSFYQAMMATLEDHATHKGVNQFGVEATHSWDAGRITVVVSKD